MFDRTRSPSRLRWWAAGIIIAIIGIALLNTGFMGPARDLMNRVTLPVQRVLRQVGDSIQGVTSSVSDLTTLRERNAELEQAVAQLTVENARLNEVGAENARLRGLLNFAQTNPSFDYKGGQVVGRVVASEPNSAVQSIVIDLGSKNGVLPGMPVVTERGLVGRITDVYSSGSRVLLITDSNSSVNAILQNSRLRGIVSGRAGQSPVMDYLPQDKPVSVGDIVVTSGEGGNFPAGIPVGQVVEVERNDVEMFQRAIVRTTVDFSTLEDVLVVTNFMPILDLDNLPER